MDAVAVGPASFAPPISRSLSGDWTAALRRLRGSFAGAQMLLRRYAVEIWPLQLSVNIIGPLRARPELP